MGDFEKLCARGVLFVPLLLRSDTSVMTWRRARGSSYLRSIPNGWVLEYRPYSNWCQEYQHGIRGDELNFTFFFSGLHVMSSRPSPSLDGSISLVSGVLSSWETLHGPRNTKAVFSLPSFYLSDIMGCYRKVKLVGILSGSRRVFARLWNTMGPELINPGRQTQYSRALFIVFPSREWAQRPTYLSRTLSSRAPLLDNGAGRRSLHYEQSCFTPLFRKSSYYSGFCFSLIVFRPCNLVHRNVGIWSGSARCHMHQNPCQFFVFTSLANDIVYHESHLALFCKTTWTPRIWYTLIE